MEPHPHGLQPKKFLLSRVSMDKTQYLFNLSLFSCPFMLITLDHDMTQLPKVKDQPTSSITLTKNYPTRIFEFIKLGKNYV